MAPHLAAGREPRRAALVEVGGTPEAAVEDAARAGASAVLVHGGLPSGSLGFDQATPIPVVDLPDSTARTMLDALARGSSVGVAIGRAHTFSNPAVPLR